MIASVGVRSYTKTEKKGKPYIVEELGANITGLNVLVVDEVVDTGESMEVVKKYLSVFKPKSMKFAVLHIKPWAKAKPDHFVEETKAWIVYPWEEVECG